MLELVAVALLNHISQVDADAKLDAALGRKSGVTLNPIILHLDGAAQSVNYANSTRLPSPATSFLKTVAPCLTKCLLS